MWSQVQVLDDPPIIYAQVVELVDTPDLGSGAERCESSSLSLSTIGFQVFKFLDEMFDTKDDVIISDEELFRRAFIKTSVVVVGFIFIIIMIKLISL